MSVTLLKLLWLCLFLSQLTTAQDIASPIKGEMGLIYKQTGDPCDIHLEDFCFARLCNGYVGYNEFISEPKQIVMRKAQTQSLCGSTEQGGFSASRLFDHGTQMTYPLRKFTTESLTSMPTQMVPSSGALASNQANQTSQSDARLSLYQDPAAGELTSMANGQGRGHKVPKVKSQLQIKPGAATVQERTKTAAAANIRKNVMHHRQRMLQRQKVTHGKTAGSNYNTAKASFEENSLGKNFVLSSNQAQQAMHDASPGSPYELQRSFTQHQNFLLMTSSVQSLPKNHHHHHAHKLSNHVLSRPTTQSALFKNENYQDLGHASAQVGGLGPPPIHQLTSLKSSLKTSLLQAEGGLGATPQPPQQLVSNCQMLYSQPSVGGGESRQSNLLTRSILSKNLNQFTSVMGTNTVKEVNSNGSIELLSSAHRDTTLWNTGLTTLDQHNNNNHTLGPTLGINADELHLNQQAYNSSAAVYQQN